MVGVRYVIRCRSGTYCKAKAEGLAVWPMKDTLAGKGDISRTRTKPCLIFYLSAGSGCVTYIHYIDGVSRHDFSVLCPIVTDF